jgi:hypothetical protein
MTTYNVQVIVANNGEITNDSSGPFNDLPSAQSYMATQTTNLQTAGLLFAIKLFDNNNNLITYQLNGLFIAD